MHKKMHKIYKANLCSIYFVHFVRYKIRIDQVLFFTLYIMEDLININLHGIIISNAYKRTSILITAIR